MPNLLDSGKNWWAKGLLFENCNCQIVCPGHVSFKQLCTHERCIGHWAIHIEEGEFRGTSLNGLNVVILYNGPQQMFSGDWTELLYIDERASLAQRQAVENILKGQVGGPWVVLSRFVSKRLETRFLPIHFEDQGRRKKMWVDGLFDTTVESIKGRDRDREVLFENMFNQIHAPTQIIASGSTRHAGEEFPLSTVSTHALYSRFSWTGN
jgi:hypothetical protein